MEGQTAAAVGKRPLQRRFQQHRLHRSLEIQAYAWLIPQPAVPLRPAAAPVRRDRPAAERMKGVAS